MALLPKPSLIRRRISCSRAVSGSTKPEKPGTSRWNVCGTKLRAEDGCSRTKPASAAKKAKCNSSAVTSRERMAFTPALSAWVTQRGSGLSTRTITPVPAGNRCDESAARGDSASRTTMSTCASGTTSLEVVMSAFEALPALCASSARRADEPATIRILSCPIGLFSSSKLDVQINDCACANDPGLENVPYSGPIQSVLHALGAGQGVTVKCKQ